MAVEVFDLAFLALLLLGLCSKCFILSLADIRYLSTVKIFGDKLEDSFGGDGAGCQCT